MIETNSPPAPHREAARLPAQGWRGRIATSAWLLQLLRGLIDGEVAHAGPFYAELSTTTLCNQGCLGCQYHSSANRGPLYSAKGTDHIRLDYVRNLCAGLQRLGTREIILTGEGEPLFHPQLLDIISLCKAAGLYVHLFTNGTLLDETMAAQLIDSGLDILRVSLWAASLEEYEKCYPGVDPANFQKTLDGVRRLSSLKTKRQISLPVVALTGPLNRHNQKGIRARIRLAGEIGADAVTFTPFRAWTGEFSAAALSPAEIDAVCEDLAQSRGLLDSLGLSHNLDEAIQRFRFGEAFLGDLPCYIGWFHTQVTVDGTVVPCGACPIPLGSLGDNSFEAIWNGLRYKAFRARSMATRGWALEEKDCNCIYCCFTRLNVRVHRYFRRLAPLLGRQL